MAFGSSYIMILFIFSLCLIGHCCRITKLYFKKGADEVKRKRESKKMVAVRLEPDVINGIRAEATKNNVTFVAVIREALRNYLK